MDKSVTPPEMLPFEEPERWLPTLGFEGAYEISDIGRARSLPRILSDGRRVRGRLLRPATDHNGYLYVNLWRNNKPHRRFVARLVLESFVGPRPPGQVIRHGPGGPLDNRASVLCWGTHSENSGIDKVRDGTIPRGEQGPMAKVTSESVMEIRRRYAAGETSRAIAADFGLTDSAVSMIAKGRRWHHQDGAVDRGLSRSERTKLAKLTAASVLEIRVRLAAGEPCAALAESYGVTAVTVKRILTGETWRHVA